MKEIIKRKGFNEYKVFGDYFVFYMESNKGIVFQAFVSMNKLQKLIEFNHSWYSAYNKRTNSFYVYCTYTYFNENEKKCNKTIQLHRFLLDAQDEEYVDHKNHDTLDNRDENIVLTTNAKNTRNRNRSNKNNKGGHLNVSYVESCKIYLVQFMKNGISYKWKFGPNEFDKACEFARKKRIELFND